MLKNRKLAQAVADSNFGEIKRQLLYKSEREQCYLVLVDRWYPSSKTCSSCGSIRDDLALSARTFVCFECGYVTERDYNAAKNILFEAQRTTVSSMGSDAYGHARSGSHGSASETSMDEVGTKHHLGMS
jgi:putative transposase